MIQHCLVLIQVEFHYLLILVLVRPVWLVHHCLAFMVLLSPLLIQVLFSPQVLLVSPQVCLLPLVSLQHCLFLLKQHLVRFT